MPNSVGRKRNAMTNSDSAYTSGIRKEHEKMERMCSEWGESFEIDLHPREVSDGFSGWNLSQRC